MNGFQLPRMDRARSASACRAWLRKAGVVAALLLAQPSLSHAVSTLLPGDIAVVGYDGKNPGDFSFVTLVPVDGNLDVTFAVSNASYVVYRTPPAGLAAGTAVVISNTAPPLTPGASAGTIATNGLYDFDSAGDHLDVKQGSTFIYVAENLATPFTEPAGLSYAAGTVVSHLNGTSGGNNGRYKGVRTGTRQEILDLIRATNNWEYSTSTPFTFTPAPFTVQSSGPRWTGTVVDGWRWANFRSGGRLSTLGILKGVQTDNNDTPTNGCYAAPAPSDAISSKTWLSVYFTNDFPSGLQILSAKVYLQHAGTNTAGVGGTFKMYVSDNRSASGWSTGGVGAAVFSSGLFSWTNVELQTVVDVTAALNTADKVNGSEILLLNSTNSVGNMYIDFVKLDVEYSLAGAPNVGNGDGASGLLPGSAQLNGQILAGSPDPQVRIYWGDNDGGTSTGNWDHVEDLGPRSVGAFYATVSGLTANRPYFYRCYATNMFGADWADSSASFTALSPAVQFTAPSSSGSEASAQGLLSVSLSGPSDVDVAVNYAATGGSAQNGTDYQLAGASLTIPAGSVSNSIAFSVINDNLDEFDETVVVSLLTPQNATLGANASHTYTIIDDDNPPSVSLASPGYTVSETAGAAVVGAVLSAPSGKPVQVAYGTQNGTALPVEDYVATNGTLSWLPGQPLTNTFSIPIVNDSAPEPSETFSVTLSAPSNCTLGAVSNSSILIADDDLGPPSVDNGIGASAVTSNSAALNGNLISDGGAATETWVYWGTVDAGTNRSTWAAGKRVGVVSRGAFSTPVTPLNRNTRYVYRCLASNIYGIGWAPVATSFLTGPPTVEFVKTNSSGDESATPVAIEMRLSSPEVYGLDVAIAYAATGGTATGGADYTLPPGVLTIPAGSSTGSIALAVQDDMTFEYDETVIVGISNAVNAVLGTNRTHTYTIVDNDPQPAVSFAGAPYTVTEGAGSQTVTAALASASEREVSVSFLTAGGTAQTVMDYVPTNGVLRWGPGQFGSRTFVVPILNNAQSKGDRTFYAVLLNPVDCTITGKPQACVTILEDDASAPAVTNRIPTGVRSTRATLNGEVSSGIPAPAVTVYWGPVDGGTNRSAWTNRVSLGSQTGVFSTVITGLASNRSYYYRCHASNAAGQAWAPGSASFATLPGRDYFVNDAGTNGDAFCSAAGNDANSGLTPAQPKATADAILATYDLGPGDTVYIDTGLYNLAASLAVTADDAGAEGQTVAFIGSTNAAGTVLRGADTSQDVINADLTASGHVRFESLRLTGGRHGLYVLSTDPDLPWTDVQVVDCKAYSNSATGAGFYLRYGSAAEAIRCEAYRNGAYGLRLNNCDQVALTGNRCDRQVGGSSYGISVFQGSGVAVLGNQCGGNGAYGLFVSAPYTRVADNVCSSNGSDGIYVSAVGSELSGNFSFANHGYGSSTPGVEETFRSNVFYSNTLGSVKLLDINNSILIENNSFCGGNGLQIRDPQAVTSRYNIIWASGSGAAAVLVPAPRAEAGSFVSDFNNLCATGGATVGVWGSDPCADLAAWRSSSAQDSNSISADPLFVSTTGGDFHLQSLGGSYHEGRWEPDLATSPSVDAADPAASFGAEPSYNGLWRNQGAFGDAPQASRTYYPGSFYTVTIITNPADAGWVAITPAAAAFPTNRPILVQAWTTNDDFLWTGWARDLGGTNLSVTFTAQSNMTIEAVFARRGWTITASAGSGGNIVPAGVISVTNGGSRSFAITPVAPRYIADVIVDGLSVGATNAWTFLNVTSNHTIHATFGGLSVNTDHGTPISWLELYGITNNYESADTNDLDRDGALTWEEYLAGTVPTNPLSVFRVIGMAVRPGSNTIVWYATTNSGVYTPFDVQSSTNLRLGGWEIAASNISRAASGTNTWSFPVTTNKTPRYYRPWLPSTNL